MSDNVDGWWAQHGEDRIARDIFRQIGTINRTAVDIGAMDGRHGSNTVYFQDRYWDVFMFDALPLAPHVIECEITAENINDVLRSWHVPDEFDLLSIDVDGNDLWLWKALDLIPSVVIIEYNNRWNWQKSRTVPYDPARRWDRTVYYGASARALCTLAAEKGYDLVAGTRSNLIFALAGLMPAIDLEAVERVKKFKRPDPFGRKWVEYGNGVGA